MGNRWGVDINRNQIERNNDAARARKFRNSIRGKYILSQSLSIAIKYLKTLEERDDPYPKYGTHAQPSNREDMEYLFNEDNKQKVIDELNKNVNIPIINEDTEEKIISAIYEVFEDVMGKVINK